MPNGSFNAQALWGNQRDVSWTEFDGLDGLERLGDSNDTLDVGDYGGSFFGEFQGRFDTLLIKLFGSIDALSPSAKYAVTSSRPKQ